MEEHEGSEQFIPVERIIVHPGWTGELGNGYSSSKLNNILKLILNLSVFFFFKSWILFLFRNDIAVLRLAEPVYGSEYTAFANLPYAHQTLPNGFTCYITGWGRLDCENNTKY